MGRSQKGANARATSICKPLCFSLPLNCLSALGLPCQPPEPSFFSTFSLRVSLSFWLPLPLSLFLQLSLGEEQDPGHSSEGRGNERAAPHEESSSALVIRRKENSSRELMRPPRTKEATSRGQGGGAQLSRPRRTAIIE